MVDTVKLSELPNTQAIKASSGNITVSNLTLTKQTNGFTIAGGTSSKTLTVPLDATVSGTNTGDQTSVTGNAGTATVLQTPRAIYGNNFDGSAALNQIIASTYGGTGNGFTKFSGATTSEKTYTLPDATSTILTSNAAVTVAQGGTGLTTLTANNVILGNGTSTPTFVAPGTSGNVLTSNGTTWTSAALAVSTQYLANNGYAANNYYLGAAATSGSTNTYPADILYGTPFVVGASETFTRIGIDVDATGTATLARLGIYNCANGAPTTLVLDCGTVSVTTTGIKEATISQLLAQGLYVLAVVLNGNCTLRQSSQVNNMTAHYFGLPAPGDQVRGVYASYSFAALPSTYPSITYELSTAQPRLHLRRV